MKQILNYFTNNNNDQFERNMRDVRRSMELLSGMNFKEL